MTRVRGHVGMKLFRRGRSIDCGDYLEYVCQVLSVKGIYTRSMASVGSENLIGEGCVWLFVGKTDYRRIG